MSASRIPGHQAVVAFGQGNYPEARERYEQCLTILRQLDDPKGFVALCLEGLAGVVCAQGEPAWAARLWGATESLRATHELPMPPAVEFIPNISEDAEEPKHG